jgi:hypothetical protein
MGWYIIMEPSTVKKKKETLLAKCALTFWRRLGEFEIAHLATSDGTGIELFSFHTELKKHLNSILSIRVFFLYQYKKKTRISIKMSYGGKTKNAYSRILSKR